MKTFFCKFCNNEFETTRIDKIRCSDCRKKYISNYKQKDMYKNKRKERYQNLKKQVFDGYGGKCECCGEKNIEFLAIDHKNGGGREERKTMSIQQISVKIIKNNFPEEYRILCHNCNQSLGWYGYCPHNNS